MKKTTFSLQKDTAEYYKINSDNGFYATIAVKDGGSCGRIMVASDYIDFTLFFGACGKPFKEFLCGLGEEYVARKLTFFDFETGIDPFFRQFWANQWQFFISELKKELEKPVFPAGRIVNEAKQ